MTVALGVMEVPAGTDGDSNRRYLNGTLPDGGLWTALRRLSDHDHTGGHNGAPISLASVPDGSITVDKLDPAVLLPYALTDGSKPFTGQVTMQADAVVRDALYFGQQGTALAPDATLSRTGAGALRVDTHLGVGVNPASWGTNSRSVQVGADSALLAASNASGVTVGTATYHDGTNWRALTSNPASTLTQGQGELTYNTAPAVASGAVQTFTTRARIALTGTLALFPDAGLAALTWPNGALQTAGTDAVVAATVGGGYVRLAAGGFAPATTDGVANLGLPTNRFLTVYAVTGAISTSSHEFKEGITPLSPERAMQAVRDTQPVTFDYVAPTRGPEWYDLPDDPEQAEAVLQQRLTAAPLEAAARHQHGFVAEQADDLFLVGPGQTSPGSSVGVLLAALQQLDARVQTLEGAA